MLVFIAMTLHKSKSVM